MSQINIIPPTSEKSSYGENDSIRFNLTYAGNSMKKGSIKILGELQVLNGGNAIDETTGIKFDSVVGAHGLFSQITCEINGQNIETIENYPMVVKARATASNYKWDFMSKSERDQTLQIGNDDLVPALIAKNANGGTRKDWNFFAVAPQIAVNMSDKDISGAKGNMTITFYLNQKNNFLYGSAVGTCTYSLQNLQLLYETVPNATNEKVVMNKTFHISQPLNTNNQQFSMSLPLVCNAVSCVFHEEGRASTANNYELEALPNLTRASFNFNDVSNAYIRYDLTHLSEYLMNYQNSWGQPIGSKNNMSLSKFYQDGDAFGIGMDFGGQFVNLSNQNWGMNLQSDVSSARPFNVSMIFHSVVEV